MQMMFLQMNFLMETKIKMISNYILNNLNLKNLQKHIMIQESIKNLLNFMKSKINALIESKVA